MLPRPVACAVLLAILTHAGAAEISVGPGRGLTSIEAAMPLAKPGDTIVIHARADGSPYTGTALRLTLPRVSLRGMPNSAGQRPVLDGGEVAYGVGKLPRAIIEIGPEAEGAGVSGFRLTGAHGRGEPAAGIRVDGADGVAIEDCEIDACDVGLLVTGDAGTARDLQVNGCTIHHNATDNVVIGGGGGRVFGCRIHHALAGRNLVSRAHRTVLEASWLHDAAGRELDLLDDPGVTDRTGGLMLVLGCVLAKRRDCPGERAVIHCGQDRGGDRVGTVYLAHCTVLTPYDSPVIELSAPGAKVALANSIIADPTGGGPGRVLVGRRGGGAVEPAWAGGLWLAYGHTAPRGTAITVGAFRDQPPFVDLASGDLHLRSTAAAPFIDSALPLAQLPLPVGALDADHPLRKRPPTLLEFRPAAPAAPRVQVGEALDLGAFELGSAQP